MSKFVVIEGLIGVGKTSLCRLLEDRWNASLVLEPVDDNPFLTQFYADRNHYAFPTQMFYLASRYAQQIALRQGELFADVVVSDYLYAKDRLFAEETLAGDEMNLYDRFATLLGSSVVPPDVIVFLDAPTDVILRRINRRAIDAEQVIDAEYLDSLRQRYLDLWDRFEDSPVYVLDTTDINYVDHEADRERILSIIGGWLNGSPHPESPPRYISRNAAQMNLFGA